MDNAPGTADGPELIQGSQPIRGPEQIRHDIDDIRARLGVTAEAIRYKTDLPQRAKDGLNKAIDHAIAEMGPALDAGARQARRGWQEGSVLGRDGAARAREGAVAARRKGEGLLPPDRRLPALYFAGVAALALAVAVVLGKRR